MSVVHDLRVEGIRVKNVSKGTGNNMLTFSWTRLGKMSNLSKLRFSGEGSDLYSLVSIMVYVEPLRNLI